MNRRPKIQVLTLGCPKNEVDSEVLLGQLRASNFEVVPAPEEAEVAIINTCGFIEPAKLESIDTILETARLKSSGHLKRLFVIGCLAQRYRAEMESELPEVDRFFGVNEHDEILAELGSSLKYDLLGERLLTTPSHYAYLKISEGCNHPCSFCAIPLMRGKHVSRPMDEIIREAKALAGRGVKELILIAQDLAYYGIDRSRKRELRALLEKLAAVDGVEWIRLMYVYPANFPSEILDLMVDNPRICRYIDLPVQHCSDRVLASMRRGMTRRTTEGLINEIRERIPDIALRTTLIVGYPEETEKEFQELLDFVEKTQFNRLGVFTYSQEENTIAEPLGDPISRAEKERRKEVIMELQKEISAEKNESLVGERVRVLLDRREGEVFYGRTEWDAPEIDNEVILPDTDRLKVGNFYEARIVDAIEYDLFASVEEADLNRTR